MSDLEGPSPTGVGPDLSNRQLSYIRCALEDGLVEEYRESYGRPENQAGPVPSGVVMGMIMDRAGALMEMIIRHWPEEESDE